MNKNLVIIPSDPISAYEKKGTSSWLEEYFNPNLYFDNVYVLSPKEDVERFVYGLQITPIKSDSEFKKLLKKIKPVCVRAYGGYWATNYANFNRVDGIPVVSSVHDTNPKLLFKGLHFSDDYFVMSHVVRDLLITKGITTDDNIQILGNRVDTKLFTGIVEKRENPLFEKYGENINILHIGRKSEQKNIETVINSMIHLPKEYNLILIGKGECEDYIELAKKVGVDDRVEFIEKVENNELVHWYNLADVLCVPSLWEGFGVVFIEAASCMTKIVTSNIAPMNEYLLNDHEMNILVDDYKNPKVISKAILELTVNKNKNENTRNKIIEKFDKKVISNKEIDFYKNVKCLQKEKTFKFKVWRLQYIIDRDYFSVMRRILKLFKRAWRKATSYL